VALRRAGAAVTRGSGLVKRDAIRAGGRRRRTFSSTFRVGLAVPGSAWDGNLLRSGTAASGALTLDELQFLAILAVCGAALLVSIDTLDVFILPLTMRWRRSMAIAGVANLQTPARAPQPPLRQHVLQPARQRRTDRRMRSRLWRRQRHCFLTAGGAICGGSTCRLPLPCWRRMAPHTRRSAHLRMEWTDHPIPLFGHGVTWQEKPWAFTSLFFQHEKTSLPLYDGSLSRISAALTFLHYTNLCRSASPPIHTTSAL